MKKLYTILFTVSAALTTLAQNEDDVLRYSMTDYQGSARFESMAGSFGALGADFSSAQINPGGLGRFTKSQFSFSLRDNMMTNSSTYRNSSSQDNANAFKIGTLGAVFTNDVSSQRSGLTFSQFFIGYTRLSNFHTNYTIKGTNEYSLLDEFAAYGDGIPPDQNQIYNQRPFTTGLAYDVFMLDYDAQNGFYYPDLKVDSRVNQVRTIEKRGGMGEFTLGGSASYKNILNFGGSFNLRTVNYKENYTHTETPEDTTGLSFRRFDYSYDQKTKGWGINLKFGAVYLPSEKFRIGLAYESPSIFELKDEWTANMTSQRRVQDSLIEHYVEPEFVPKGVYEYQLLSPMRTRISLAYILQLRGSINVDLEHVGYGMGRLLPIQGEEENPYDFKAENKSVKNIYRSVINMRIGAEYSFFGKLFVRGGIAYLPSPYEKDISSSRAQTIYSGGLGLKWKNNQIDIAYKHLQFDTEYYMVSPLIDGAKTDINTLSNSIILSYTLSF